MIRNWLARTAWTVLTFALVVILGLLVWEPFFAFTPGHAPPKYDYRAEITRDEWGVPHIHARTDPEVAFGIAYAHAEDDFSTLQDVFAMARGRYGAIAGEDGAKVDFIYHLLNVRGTVDGEYAKLPADVHALLDGYAAGLNRFAATHPGEIKLANLFPVTGEDIAAGFALRQPFFYGLGSQIGPLAEGKLPRRDHGPPTDGKPAPAYAQGGGDQIDLAANNTRPGPLPVGEDADLAGSNAFAIAPKRSGDGVTRLVSNAHQPWRGGTAWYELVVESDEGWHMAGATFPGMPLVALGHNDTLGWTNTVNRPDLVDVYRLVLNADGTQYRLDGQWKPLEKRTVWLPVRFGPLTLPIPRTVWRSAHGPVIVSDQGAFAVRYAGIGSLGNLTEYYRLNRARDMTEWMAALKLMAIPSTNFLYADTAGNIAYVYNAMIPQRVPGQDWRGILPGDRSDLIWRKTVPFEAVPQILNPASGFLYNANNTPFLAAGKGSELDPAKFAPEMGVELDVTNRTRRAALLLDATNPIGRTELERIKYDTGYERTGYVAWMLDAIARLDLRGEPKLVEAQKLLATWDLQADGKGRADALAVMVLKEAMASSYNLKPAPDPKEELRKATEHLETYWGRIDPPLGEVIRVRQGTTDLPMDGGGDTLRAATSWNVDPDDGRLLIKHGDSFVMFIEWPAGGGAVRSESIQPFGAATTRPKSRHYADQAPLFVAHRLKPVHFERADIAAHAVSRTVVTSR